MIVDLANDVCTSIDEIDRLGMINTNMQSVKASYDALQTVIEDGKQLSAYIVVVGQKLPDTVQESIRQSCASILRDITSSRENFEHEPRQTKALSAVKKQFQDIIKEIKLGWQQYVNDQIQEPFELLDLVWSLPEVVTLADLYTSIQERLRRSVNEVPMHPEQLKTFEQNVHNLIQLLNSIEGLSPDVKTFLRKIMSGQATLVDLTDEVLAWCRQGRHPEIFRITFGK
jgi:hypothetical protein